MTKNLVALTRWLPYVVLVLIGWAFVSAPYTAFHAPWTAYVGALILVAAGKAAP